MSVGNIVHRSVRLLPVYASIAGGSAIAVVFFVAVQALSKTIFDWGGPGWGSWSILILAVAASLATLAKTVNVIETSIRLDRKTTTVTISRMKITVVIEDVDVVAEADLEKKNEKRDSAKIGKLDKSN
ncbi:hypothetical protein [Bradyrhizobium sp.]